MRHWPLSFRHRSPLPDPKYLFPAIGRFRRHPLDRPDRGVGAVVGEPLEDAYFAAANEETKDAFNAYAEGVNAWLGHLRAGHHGAKLSAEYQSGLLYGVDEIRDWEPEDSVTLYLQLAYQYSWGRDSAEKAAIGAIVGPDAIEDIAGGDFAIKSPMIHLGAPNALRSAPTPPAAADLSYLQNATGALRRAAQRNDAFPSVLLGESGPSGLASNWWVVGPDKTADGSSLLANDPHLDMTNPSIWYMAELHSAEGLHVAGASVPGVLGVIAGHNEDIAWGVTVNMWHMSDNYIETLTEDGLGVMIDGQRVDIVQREYAVEGRFDSSSTATLEWVPGHGPIVAKDLEAGVAVTVKWVGHTPGDDINFFLELLRARSVAEADVALDPIRALNINWSVADRGGNIAWFPKGQIPERPWITKQQPWWLPVPGDGSAEWGPMMDSDDLFRLVNPPEGFIANSNNELDDRWVDGDPTNDGVPWSWAQNAEEGEIRHARAVELLSASSEHDLESMGRIHADVYSYYASRLLPPILEAASNVRAQLTPAAENVFATLESWNYECPTGLEGSDPVSSPASTDPEVIAAAAGCSAFHVFLVLAASALTDDELDEIGGIGWLESSEVLSLLFLEPDVMLYGEKWYDDALTPEVETRDDHLRASLEATAERLQTEFESATPEDWLWGRIHAAELPSFIQQAAYALGPVSTTGGYATLNKANPANRYGSAQSSQASGLNHIDGASTRLLFHVTADGIEARFQLPAGQVHSDPESALYDNLLPKWLAFEYTTIPFTAEAVAQTPAFEELVVED